MPCKGKGKYDVSPCVVGYEKSLKSQLREANKMDALATIIVGDKVELKTMWNGVQKDLNLKDIKDIYGEL